MDGTAEAPGDYTARSAVSVTFQPDEDTQTVPVTINTDDIAELTEVFFGRLMTSPGDTSVILTQDTATVNIIDSNAILVEFDPTSYTVNEGDGFVEFEIVRWTPATESVTVLFSTVGGSATGGVDYTERSLFEVTIPPSDGEGRVQVRVAIADDNINEEDEQFSGELTLPDGSEEVRLGASTATATIIDNDRVTIGFQPVSFTVAEEAQFVIVSASVLGRGTLARVVAVDFATVRGTATLSDFSDTTTTLTFNPISLTRNVTIPITDDNIVEAVETFFATLTAEDDQPVDLSPDLADIDILDLVDPIIVGFEETTYTVGEGRVVEVCAIIVSGMLDRDAIVRLSSVNDEAVAPGDYITVVEDLTFSADVDRVCRNVTSQDDTILEDDEEFTLTLTTSDGSVNLAPDQATFTIIDNDTVTIGFEQTLYFTTEGVDSVVELYAIVMGSTILERTAIVSFSTRDGSATSIAPVDYVEAVVDLIFGPGVSRRCVNVTIVNDVILEGEEDFFSTFTTTDLDVFLIPNEAQVVIADNNYGVTIGFVPAIYSVWEWMPQVTVTVVLIDGILETSVTVNLHTTGATATADVDYTNIPPSGAVSLVFDPLNSVRSVNITIINDRALERDEIFFGELTTTFSTVALNHQQANILIIDGTPAAIGFLETRYTAEEEDGMVNLLVGLIGLFLTKDIVVRLSTEDGTATQPMDYLEVDTLLTFGPTVSTILVPVTIINDLVDEPREEFEAELELITVSNVAIAPSIATVIINGVTISLERVTYSVTEGGGTVEVCAVLLNCTLTRNAVVTLSTSDGSAVEPMDYGRISLQLTFNATVSRACADVTIVDDDVFEIEESFNVTLTAINGDVTLEPDSGIIFITDEDELEIGYEFPEYTVDETAGSVEVCVVVTIGIVGTNKQVTFSLEEASATEPEDYGFPSSVVYTFRPRATRECVDIPIVNDNLVDREFLERFFGNLIGTDPASPRITLNPDRTRITIVDHDDLRELDLSFTGNSPQLGTGTITAELFTNRPGVQIVCFLRRTNFRQDCSNGSITFTGIPAGRYTLQVIATDRVISGTAEIRTFLFVPGSNEFCSVYAINQLVSVVGNSSSAEFRSTGRPAGFQCRVDRQSYFPCTSPVTITGLDSGGHVLRVRPQGCGRSGSGHQSLSIVFNV